MNKYLRIFLIVFGIMLAFSYTFINDTVVVGEQLCVDGKNNINLEGMMCEKSEYKIDGFSAKQSMLISVLLVTLGLFIFGVGLFVFSEDSE